MQAYERLIKYAKVYTTSDPKSETTPSTKRQFDLANILVEEMKEIGIQDVKLDETVMFMELFQQLRDTKISLALDLLHIWIRHQQHQEKMLILK